MHPNYSSIPNNQTNPKCSDIESQANCCHHPSSQACHCQSTIIIERRKRNSSSCCSLPLIIFILLGLIFIKMIPIGTILKDRWNTKNVYFSCSSTETPNVHWQGNSVYYIPQDIKGLQIFEKNERSKLSLNSGKVNVVENRGLKQTKITFDIKLSNNLLQDSIRINQKQNKDKLELTIVHEKNGFYGCVEINTLIEVPSSSALNKLDLGFLNDKITINDSLTLEQELSLSVANGDLTIKNPIETTTMSLSLANGNINVEKSATASSFTKLNTANGNISGYFQLKQQSQLDANVANGQIDLTMDSISSGSTITAQSAAGNINIQVPSSFESQYKLTSTIGKVNIDGTHLDKLHYRRSGHILGETVDGNYGDHENSSSKIKASTAVGDIKLYYK